MIGGDAGIVPDPESAAIDETVKIGVMPGCVPLAECMNDHHAIFIIQQR